MNPHSSTKNTEKNKLNQAVRLLQTRLFYNYNYLRENLANEAAAGIATLAIVGLFAYIVTDFINVEIKAVNSSIHRDLAQLFSYLIIIVTAGYTSWSAANQHHPGRQIEIMAKMLGESPQSIKVYRRLYQTLIVIITATASLGFIDRWLIKLDSHQTGFYLLIMIGVYLIVFLTAEYATRPLQETSIASQTTTALEPVAIGPVQLRLRQLARNNVLVLVTAGFLLYLDYLIWNMTARQSPFFLAYFICYLSGLLVTIPLLQQLKKDLEHSWAERSFGLSHERFVATYNSLAVITSLPVAVLFASTLFLAAIATHSHALDSSQMLDQALKILLVIITPALISPNLMFQVDARRPFLNLMIVLLVSLLLMTAIYVHAAFGLLILGVKLYGENMQRNRYYRA